MAMVASRLFNRSRRLYASKKLMPSLPIPKCNTHAYSVMEFYETGGTKRVLDKKSCENMWNNCRSRAAEIARVKGSPFCYVILEELEDLASTDNALSDPEEKKLEEYLRNCKDIKFYTEIDSILEDHRLKEFQSSMTADDIRICVTKHLYVLTLQNVIPLERLYMEHLISKFHSLEVEDIWYRGYKDYEVTLASYSRLFSLLPWRVLVRGFELHMSRIPLKHSGKKNLAKAFRKKMLSELRKDFELLTTRIHDLPRLMYEDMMLEEIDALVHLWTEGYSSIRV